ncbi:hypothetical protein GH714_035245 [Hevea brasiliensis]|uniref:non-specific serine/threonine protein kinase n=1 Tax=Hevea brasiliensis TaxID=3981 RepID=A0A6A6NE80_HEVBR|nr:hypothetical protein GH714_035245 [Hevea brasiliensis]
MISCAAECVYKPSELRPQMKEIVRTLEEYIPPVDMDANDNNFLLELITGRKPIDEGIHIVHWAKTRIIRALKEEYVTFVDSNLQDYDGEEMKRMIFCAASCIYKPLNCRPTMKKIVQTLEQDTPLKDIWDDNDYSFLHVGGMINEDYVRGAMETDSFARVWDFHVGSIYVFVAYAVVDKLVVRYALVITILLSFGGEEIKIGLWVLLFDDRALLFIIDI